MVSTITTWVVRHKRLVIGFWIVLTLVGGAASGPASKAMDQKFSVPGREGWDANKAIEQTFKGTGGNSAPLVPVVQLMDTAADSRSRLAALETKIKNAVTGRPAPGYGSRG